MSCTQVLLNISTFGWANIEFYDMMFQSIILEGKLLEFAKEIQDIVPGIMKCLNYLYTGDQIHEKKQLIFTKYL